MLAKQVKPKVTTLPSYLTFDKFKSTRDVSAAMSFIYCEAETHKIADILPDRR
ncbi:transposase [Staphylococcus auricularis]